MLVGALARCRREFLGVSPATRILIGGVSPESTRMLVGSVSPGVDENFDWGVSPVATSILVGALALRREC